MSPKSNKSGISYDERDPRGSIPAQADAAGPRVTRARDMDAAAAGLPSLAEVEQARGEMDDSFVNEQTQGPVEGDGSGETEPVAPDNYDDKVAWSYAALQQESLRRELDGPVNVSRDELVARLREDDATSPGND